MCVVANKLNLMNVKPCLSQDACLQNTFFTGLSKFLLLITYFKFQRSGKKGKLLDKTEPIIYYTVLSYTYLSRLSTHFGIIQRTLHWSEVINSPV